MSLLTLVFVQKNHQGFETCEERKLKKQKKKHDKVMERFHKKIRISMATVACMRRRSDRPPSHVFVSIYQI